MRTATWGRRHGVRGSRELGTRDARAAGGGAWRPAGRRAARSRPPGLGRSGPGASAGSGTNFAGRGRAERGASAEAALSLRSPPARRPPFPGAGGSSRPAAVPAGAVRAAELRERRQVSEKERDVGASGLVGRLAARCPVSDSSPSFHPEDACARAQWPRCLSLQSQGATRQTCVVSDFVSFAPEKVTERKLRGHWESLRDSDLSKVLRLPAG